MNRLPRCRDHAHAQQHVEQTAASHDQRRKRRLLHHAVIHHNGDGQQRGDDARSDVLADQAGNRSQGNAGEQQQKAEQPCLVEQNAPRRQRSMRPLARVDFIVIDIVQDHARRIKQAGGPQQEPELQRQAQCRRHQRVREQIAHQHIGDGREDIGQTQQLEPGTNGIHETTNSAN
jgi:hypothetical protein